MPYVNSKSPVKVWLQNKKPATTVVIINEVDTDNWVIAGVSVTVQHARGA